ncbi:MAG: desaturase [Sulfobacillus acidophilus]|uniref:Desaturase n=1 Tax=Sulfobacillus acidophilus TaxID=53633 RepID=A0A2T2WH36_9FIRM|nr:MAG: desaturase [Sulfobacillus acidophilus]
MPRYDVAVVGAGWSGLAAAFYLSQHGMRVLLLEAARRVGGRTFSFVHRPTGQVLDNGVHVLLGLCDQFQTLLDAAGLTNATRYQPLLDVPVASAEGPAWIRSAPLNGAAHLMGSIVSYPLLTPSERVSALWAGLRIERLKQADRWDAFSWGDWLRNARQGSRAQRYLWDAIGTGVLNAHANDVSAALALKTFQLLLRGGWRGARLGLFGRPLSDIVEELKNRLIDQNVTIRLGEEVKALEVEAGSVTALVGSERYPVPHVVMAIPPKRLAEILQHSALPAPVSLAPFAVSPILNVYLFFDQKIWPHDFMLLPDDWGAMVFNRTRLLPSMDQTRDTLAVSISAANMLRGGTASEVATAVTTRVRARLGLPAPEHIQAVWQPEATFLARPGSESMRPGPETPIRGMVLAGDWTGTGWPACLEGAVRSGRTAAQVCLGLGEPQALTLP